MIDLYQGKVGRSALLDAMRAQFLVEGNTEIADILASATVLKEFPPESVLFNDGDRGGDLFFILCGRVSVRKGDRELDTVSAGVHLGEIGLLEPFKGRSATVVAIDTVVAAQIALQRFITIGDLHPILWRRIALKLAHRIVKTQDAV
jgi:CRP-like cAMP-binding protein